jgi:S1-C subfamily serine protease
MSVEDFGSRAEASARAGNDHATSLDLGPLFQPYDAYSRPDPTRAPNAQPSRPAQNWQELKEQIAPSAVQVSAPVYLFNLIPINEALGTGFFVSSGQPNSCEVATAYHVGESPKEVKITTHDGQCYKATPEKLDPQHDLAIYKVNGVSRPAEVCRDLPLNTNPEPNLPVLVLDGAVDPVHPDAVHGRTLGLRPRTDIRESRRWGVEDMNAELIATNLQTRPGFSGGPVVDTSGHVRGVHVMHDGPAYEEQAKFLQADLEAIKAERESKK